MGRAGRVGWLLGLVFAEHERLADAVAGAGEFDEPSVVDDAVDDRGGEFVVGEDRAPFAELDVRGEDDAASLVRAGGDLVEQAGAVDVEGRVAEFVEDEQIGFGDVLGQGRGCRRVWPCPVGARGRRWEETRRPCPCRRRACPARWLGGSCRVRSFHRRPGPGHAGRSRGRASRPWCSRRAASRRRSRSRRGPWARGTWRVS